MSEGDDSGGFNPLQANGKAKKGKGLSKKDKDAKQSNTIIQ